MEATVHTAVTADPADFVELAVDLDQVLALHPRLLAVRWLDAPCRVGSRAEVTVSLPPVLAALRPLVGDSRGTVTLAAHAPGAHVVYRLDAARVTGEVRVDADRSGPAPRLRVHGRLEPKAALARLALAPSAGAAGLLLTLAARRTVARADAILTRRATARR